MTDLKKLFCRGGHTSEGVEKEDEYKVQGWNKSTDRSCI